MPAESRLVHRITKGIILIIWIFCVPLESLLENPVIFESDGLFDTR